MDLLSTSTNSTTRFLYDSCFVDVYHLSPPMVSITKSRAASVVGVMLNRVSAVPRRYSTNKNNST